MARVLFVDDDNYVRSFLRLALRQLGHDVFEAEDGYVAIDICRHFRPDLVLCDLFMPAGDGLDTIRELRDLDASPPIIAMNGGDRSASENCLAIARRYGAVAVINKPFNVSALAALIHFVLLRRSSPNEKVTADAGWSPGDPAERPDRCHSAASVA